MARKRNKGTLKPVDQEQEQALRQHLQCLGLENVEDYKAWCRNHGFSQRLDKGWPQQNRERLVATREVATTRLAEYKKMAKFPDAIIGVFKGTLRLPKAQFSPLAGIQRASQATDHDHLVRAKTQSLLLHCQPITNFLDESPALPQYGRQAGNTWVDALVAIAHHWRGWLRPVEEWRPRTHNTRRQFSSLVRHLLAEYPVPTFMDFVWFMGAGAAATRRQRWYTHIASGQNLRTADVPIPLTKRMAHHVMQAPNHFTVDQALCWGQVLGIGGTSRLAEAIATTRLAEHFENDEFWMTVIRFFIDNPMQDLVHVGPIIDYLQNQRFEQREEFLAAGVLQRRPPPQPNLTMKGRSPEALLRQVERWHHQARGKRNVLPDAKPKDILRRWAAQEGLTLLIP